MLKGRFAIMLGCAVALGVASAATVVAHDGHDAVPTNAVVTEDGPPAVDDRAPDPEGRSGVAAAPDGSAADYRPRTYEPGAATVVPPDSELGRKLNPSADPNIRLCRHEDGTITVIHTTPAPGKPPYPDTPEDKRERPC